MKNPAIKAKYIVSVFEDYSINIEAIPVQERSEKKSTRKQTAFDLKLEGTKIITSKRFMQLMLILEFVMTQPLANNTLAFKSVVSKAIKEVAEELGVSEQTVIDKICRKGTEFIRIDDFVQMLYSLLTVVVNTDETSGQMQTTDFWRIELSNCTEDEQAFAASFIRELTAR